MYISLAFVAYSHQEEYVSIVDSIILFFTTFQHTHFPFHSTYTILESFFMKNNYLAHLNICLHKMLIFVQDNLQ